MSSQPTDIKSSSTQPLTSSSSSTKTPVTLQPTAYIADGAYVRGTHPITIGSNTLIHPRTYILSLHSPLSIASSTLILPKAVVGAPLPTSNTSTTDQPASTPSLAPNAKPTTIGSHVQIHPQATIYHSTTISDHCIIESHATILPGASVGQHSKICSGITVSGSIPEWTVVYGNGDMRRLRKPLPPVTSNANLDGGSPSDGLRLDDDKPPENDGKTTITIQALESQRIISLAKEREAATAIFRNNARLNAARQKAQSRERVSLK